MKRLLLTTLLVALTSATRADVPPNQLTEAEQRSGWRLLFDGTSTDGWRNYQRKDLSDGWVVEDGALVRKQKGAGDVVTAETFDNFELQIEYRISEGGNSGIMFHVTEELPKPWQTGPEIQIQDNVDGHDPQKSGWLYQLYKPVKPGWAVKFEKQVGFESPDVVDATRPAGDWNHVYLRITPQQCEVCVNGVSYYYFDKGSEEWDQRVAASKFAKFPLFGEADEGHLCLQDHGDVVAFRSIKVRELPEDGQVPEPVDGKAKAKTVLAFPNVQWEGWSPVDEKGRPNPPLRPIHITHAGDGTDRIFVVDQSGMIHVLPNDPKAKRATLFLDLRDRVHHFTKDDEEGLLGFAFHPDYRENGELFVFYNVEGKPRGMQFSRFRVSKNDPNKADPNSEEILMEVQQPFANHNGGPMAFGPDGYLYIGMGDGGGRNDPMGLAQKRDTVMGGLLRIDVDHRDPGKKYAVPSDNPFIGHEGVLPELYAWGLRNPWRISFDRETGELWLADVGQDLWEEINVVEKGGNYGWSLREGSYAFGNAEGASSVETIGPVWEYDHRVGKSITGGHVYRGEAVPDLAGHYLHGDYVSGKLWALHYDLDAGEVVRNVSIDWNGLPVLAFGEDEAGESFVTTPSQNGKGIYRIVAE